MPWSSFADIFSLPSVVRAPFWRWTGPRELTGLQARHETEFGRYKQLPTIQPESDSVLAFGASTG
jgi:hypothetical protein